mgnify:CR=1 FL=1
MQQREVEIVNKLGLHARASAKLTQAAAQFASDVWVTLPRDRFEGLKAQLQTREPFVAPYSRGQKAGIMKLVRDNAVVAEVAVVALDDVPVAGFLSRGWDSIRLLFR